MLIIYPTETCYGLGCNAFNKEEVLKVYELKNRALNKPLIVLVNSFKMWQEIARVSEESMQLAKKHWPGPLTIIQPKKSVIPDVVAQKEVGVRWSPHPIPNEIIKRFNAPLTSTSANISGGINPYRIEDIPKNIINNVDKVLNEGELVKNPPSTVVRVSEEGSVEILRKGKIKL